MKSIVTLLTVVLLFPIVAVAQVEMVNRNDLLQENDVHSGVPVGIADMNGDGLDDIVSLNQARYLTVQYQTPDPARPFVRYEIGRNVDNGEQNDIVIADFNNDGANDILVSGTYDRIKVYYAVPFTYRFNQVIITASFFSQGASAGDFNHDGWVDAVLLNDNGPNYTLMNDGAGNLVIDDLFNWVTVPASDNSGNYGSVYTDFDMDGDLDFYIAKCRQGVGNPNDPRRINVLHENNGNGQYTENAKQYGLASGRQSWTADFGDIDNDGDLDCFMTQHDVISEIFENINNDTFIDITATSGLAIPGIPLQGMFRDFDNDGFVDLLVTGDRVDFYRNNGDKTFSVMNSFGSTIFGTYGMGDLNQDGFTDVYASRVIPFNTPDDLREDILYLNTPNDNNWLAFDLRQDGDNIYAVGAMALLYGEWGVQVREVRSGEQYGVSNSFKLMFGLGQATTYDSLVVRWPDGTREKFNALSINEHHIVNKGGCTSILQSYFEPFGVLCGNDSIQLVSGWAGIEHSILWSNGSTADTIHVKETGLYYPVISGGFNPCPFQYLPIEIIADPDTVRPAIAYEGMTSLCRGEIASLSLGSGLSYTWSNGETGQSIDATESGEYFAEVQGYCSVQLSDTISLSFLVPPAPEGEDDTFKLGESATLFATGDTIAWYADPEGTILIGTGNTLVLNDLTETTTVYAQNHASLAGTDFNVGPATQTGSNKYNATFINGGLTFTVTEPLIVNQITVYTDSIGPRIIEITKDGFLFQDTVDLVEGENVLDLNAALDPGNYTISTNTDYNVEQFGNNSPILWRSSSDILYPYEVPGVMSITNSTYGEDFYYYFYDWKLTTQPRYCTSELTPVVAFLDPGVAVDPVLSQPLEIAPNPTTGEVSLTLPSRGKYELTIMAADGSVLNNMNDLGNESDKLSLQLSGYPQGVYMIRLRQSGLTYLARIILL